MRVVLVMLSPAEPTAAITVPTATGELLEELKGTRGCGFPVKRAWKGQVVSGPDGHGFFPCFYSTGVQN